MNLSKTFCFTLTVSLICATAHAQHEAAPWSSEYRADQVKELKREGRLPEWANYICGPDQIGLHGGTILLIAYQQFGTTPDGYVRGLTYQEYFGADEKKSAIQAINMPDAPEEARAAIQAGLKKNSIPANAYDYMVSENQAIKNQLVIAKATVGHMTDAELADPMTRALLDGPDGTNYRNLVSSNPDVFTQWLAMQKYENTGWALPHEVKIYSEGNVIYEKGFKYGGTFESRENDGLTHVRIQLTPTPSGLRLDESHLRVSPMTISNACDPVASQY